MLDVYIWVPTYCIEQKGLRNVKNKHALCNPNIIDSPDRNRSSQQVGYDTVVLYQGYSTLQRYKYVACSIIP